VYRVPRLTASLSGPRTLSIALESLRSQRPTDRVRSDDLVPDHGHLVHLFLVRAPGLDRVFHLHPERESAGRFVQELPAVPAGRYEIFADIVHATGFPETGVGEITLPDIPGAPLMGDDSSGAASPLVAPIDPTTVVSIGGGARVRWIDGDSRLRAGEADRRRWRRWSWPTEPPRCRT
jgi:hypothetical protein